MPLIAAWASWSWSGRGRAGVVALDQRVDVPERPEAGLLVGRSAGSGGDVGAEREPAHEQGAAGHDRDEDQAESGRGDADGGELASGRRARAA
jgi:hypothetical protein